MSAAGIIINGILSVASVAFPAAAPLLGIIQRIEPYGEAALPLLRTAVTEGPAAFAAAKAAAPELFEELQGLANFFKSQLAGEGAVADDHELAILASHIAGVDPPGWTHEETQRWWDRGAPAGSN